MAAFLSVVSWKGPEVAGPPGSHAQDQMQRRKVWALPRRIVRRASLQSWGEAKLGIVVGLCVLGRCDTICMLPLEPILQQRVVTREVTAFCSDTVLMQLQKLKPQASWREDITAACDVDGLRLKGGAHAKSAVFSLKNMLFGKKAWPRLWNSASASDRAIDCVVDVAVCDADRDHLPQEPIRNQPTESWAGKESSLWPSSLQDNSISNTSRNDKPHKLTEWQKRTIAHATAMKDRGNILHRASRYEEAMVQYEGARRLLEDERKSFLILGNETNIYSRMVGNYRSTCAWLALVPHT